MFVSQTYIVHREEDQKCSLGVHRNGGGSGLKFLHSFLFRTDVHLGTIAAGLNSLGVEFFWFWIVVLGAILYQMPGLRLKMRLYNTYGFHSFIDDICYAVALLHCGVGLSESRLMVWDPFLRVKVFIKFLSKTFLVLLNLSIVSWLDSRMQGPLDFSQFWVSLLFVQPLMV